eukprot:2162499-Pleurochrysis_carterae.AAC.1
MCTSRRSAVSGTGSASATPVKSSIYTCRYRGSACPSPPTHSSRLAICRLRAAHARAAAGGGCASSKRACAAC